MYTFTTLVAPVARPENFIFRSVYEPEIDVKEIVVADPEVTTFPSRTLGPPAPIGNCAEGRVPLLIFEAFVASVLHDAAALLSVEHDGCATVIAAPALVCISTLFAPPVLERSVV